ncbi:hypothetical protein CLV51_11042 [Chitinophaga niastensis]|uniref:Uncharacterized protein n=1 Tax=Chitinophaga niastensis TaxID=536980 RepID=A0A2P8H9B2_CHINA|nr:hypothetical protein [Chitinophaga niastensis]PSL42826.1 hypothetical protein CLV51_11042 [Chitinophaga niastensis]
MSVSIFQSSPVLLALFLSLLTYALVQIYIKFKGKLENKDKDGMLQVAGQDPHFYNNLQERSYSPLHIPVESEMQIILEPEEDDESIFELVEDDTSILLKEAENVTEQISHVINNIASNPPNPAEVFTKISAIVSQYKIFMDTEFYDAINRYIYITAERDLKITFTQSQLQEMW